MPLLASVPAAGAAHLAVGAGHCRNTVVAGLFGLAAAAVLYLGYFHAHFVAVFGSADCLAKIVAPERGGIFG